MRTTWTGWSLDKMREDAEAEAWAGLTALRAPERHAIETLPYFGAFDEYREHVFRCSHCIDDRERDCPEGEALLEVSRIGVAEQKNLAAFN